MVILRSIATALRGVINCTLSIHSSCVLPHTVGEEQNISAFEPQTPGAVYHINGGSIDVAISRAVLGSPGLKWLPNPSHMRVPREGRSAMAGYPLPYQGIQSGEAAKWLQNPAISG